MQYNPVYVLLFDNEGSVSPIACSESLEQIRRIACNAINHYFCDPEKFFADVDVESHHQRSLDRIKDFDSSKIPQKIEFGKGVSLILHKSIPQI